MEKYCRDVIVGLSANGIADAVSVFRARRNKGRQGDQASSEKCSGELGEMQ